MELFFAMYHTTFISGTRQKILMPKKCIRVRPRMETIHIILLHTTTWMT